MSRYLRAYAVLLAALAPSWVAPARATYDWTCTVVTVEANPHAEWCPECAGLPNLGRAKVAKGER
jgi:hypothetical protein